MAGHDMALDTRRGFHMQFQIQGLINTRNHKKQRIVQKHGFHLEIFRRFQTRKKNKTLTPGIAKQPRSI